jgi:hypothetical protein
MGAEGPSSIWNHSSEAAAMSGEELVRSFFTTLSSGDLQYVAMLAP